MVQDAAVSGLSHDWQPDELGLPRATGLSLLLVGLILAFCLFASGVLTQLPKPTPAPQPAPQQAAAPRTDGVPVYGAQMHAILQANQNVPPALAQLCISGTAYVEITVAPDGHVIAA